MDDYMPHNITSISVVDWIPVVDEKNVPHFLNLVVQWQPALDRTCSYDVVFFGLFGEENDVRIDERNVEMENLYEFTIDEYLNFGKEYSIAVRGKNTKHLEKQSNVQWVKIKAPDSLDDEESPPEKIRIQNLTINELKHLGKNHFNVNITWITNINPDSYVISIHDADENNHNITTEPVILGGEINSFIFKDVKLLGTSFRVMLIAFKDNQNATAVDFKFIPIYEQDKLDDILFYSLVAFMFLLLIALFKVWKGRIDSFISILAQKRLEHMDLETVKTISTGTVLDSIAELTKDASMEIETENITMLESLGEGAFGLVKKALVIRNGEKQYVAVKMLKSKTIVLNLK
jgi:hypothetical protein